MAESSTEGRNMQRSIFSRFIFLIIVSVIICGISSSVIFKIKQDISTKKWIEETTYLISKMYNHSSPLLSDISNEMVYSIFIVDNNGLCISDPNNNYDYSHNPEFINAQEGFVTTLTRSEDNPLVYYLFASLKLYDGNVVIVKHKYSGIFQYVFDNLPAILLAMSVAFVLALFLARNYAKSLTLSIEKINQLQLEKDKMDQLQKQRQEFFFKCFS